MQQQRTNRDKLLDGALACLRERGYGNTSSRDIARAAGVNIASINYHFGSRRAARRCARPVLFDVEPACPGGIRSLPRRRSGRADPGGTRSHRRFVRADPPRRVCVCGVIRSGVALRGLAGAPGRRICRRSAAFGRSGWRCACRYRHSTAGEPVDHRLGVDGGHRWPHDPVDRRSVRHPAIDRGNPSACQHRRGRHVAVAVNHTVAGWSALRLMPTSMKPAAPSHAAVSRVGGTR